MSLTVIDRRSLLLGTLAFVGAAYQSKALASDVLLRSSAR